MNRLFRLLCLWLRSRWTARCAPLGPCITPLRVWPNDLDVLLHVNNGVYFTLCDLARVDLLFRSGSVGLASAGGRAFLVARRRFSCMSRLPSSSASISRTQVVGWDDKAFFVQHRFWIPIAGASLAKPTSPGQKTIAVAVVEGRVHDRKKGRIPPAELLRQLGIPVGAPPALPQWINRWRTDQRALRKANRAAEANTVPASR